MRLRLLPMALLFSAMFIAMLPIADTETILLPDDPTRDDGLLNFLNDQTTTTEELLDVDCAIRSDSAKHLIKHRDGKDKTPFTADDDLFDSVAEVDDVPMVGSWTIEQLINCARNFGYYEVPAPVLLSPADGAELQNNWWYSRVYWSFSWEPVDGADSYHFQLFAPGDTTPTYDRTNVRYSGLIYVLPYAVVAEEDRYGWTWQVQVEVAGAWSNYSETRSFDVGPGNDVTFLDDNISSLDPVLQDVIIDLKHYADGYLIYKDPYNEVYTNANLSEVNVFSQNGVVVAYGVHYYQVIDYEYGIGFHVLYGLDAGYNVVYESFSFG